MEDYMSPEDKAALIAMAGPFFAQSKFIDDNSIDQFGNRVNGQAYEIQHALERDFRNASPPPTHVPPSYIPQIAPPVTYSQEVIPHIEYQYHEIPVVYNRVDETTDQLEFNFKPSEQQKTNDLLKEISQKLTKLISLLEQKPKENVTKLKSPKDQFHKLTKQSS